MNVLNLEFNKINYLSVLSLDNKLDDFAKVELVERELILLIFFQLHNER